MKKSFIRIIFIPKVRTWIQRKNASRIAEYIANQLKEDELGEQLTISELGAFMGGK